MAVVALYPHRGKSGSSSLVVYFRSNTMSVTFCPLSGGLVKLYPKVDEEVADAIIQPHAHMKSTTSQLFACLIALPSVASLAVGPRASVARASMGSNNPEACTRLESQKEANTAAPFHEGRYA